MSFLMPSVKKPPPPPNTPTKADASVVAAGERGYRGFDSMVSSGAAGGLKRKADTKKTSLIGGA
jgi:hypothetical protein